MHLVRLTVCVRPVPRAAARSLRGSQGGHARRCANGRTGAAAMHGVVSTHHVRMMAQCWALPLCLHVHVHNPRWGAPAGTYHAASPGTPSSTSRASSSRLVCSTHPPLAIPRPTTRLCACASLMYGRPSIRLPAATNVCLQAPSFVHSSGSEPDAGLCAGAAVDRQRRDAHVRAAPWSFVGQILLGPHGGVDPHYRRPDG